MGLSTNVWKEKWCGTEELGAKLWHIHCLCSYLVMSHRNARRGLLSQKKTVRLKSRIMLHRAASQGPQGYHASRA